MLGPADQHQQGEHAQGEQRQKQVVGGGLVLLEQGFAGPQLRGGQPVAVLQQPDPAAQPQTDQHTGAGIDPGQQGNGSVMPSWFAPLSAHGGLVMLRFSGSPAPAWPSRPRRSPSPG